MLAVRQGINLHKWLVGPIYLATISWYGLSHKPCAVALLVSHTLYTLAWLFKDIHSPDPNFRKEEPVAKVMGGFIFCIPYYLPMFCLLSGKCYANVTSGCDVVVMAIGLTSYTIGTFFGTKQARPCKRMFFHFGSDCQKYYVLKYKVPRSLITDGFFAYTRNPNYFGEILIYTGYAVWSRSLMVFGIFLVQWAMVFLPNMLDKDKSMSRYTEFKDWKATTGFCLPWIPSLVRDFITLTLNNPNASKHA